MKTMKSFCMPLFILAGAVAGAGAETFRTDINPALLYYQAFLVAPDPMSEADMDYLGSRDGQAHKLPERFDAMAAGYDSQFKLARRAARSNVPCDWGIDMSDGTETLLPHLSRCKAVAQAAQFRARWECEHGRDAEACDDLLASIVLARNVARDGTLISVLVQNAAEAIDYHTIAWNFGSFSLKTLAQLAAGLDAAPARATVADAITTEKAMFRDWLLRQMTDLRDANPNDNAKAMTGIHELLGRVLEVKDRLVLSEDPQQTDWWGRVSLASGGTSDGVIQLMRDLDGVDARLKDSPGPAVRRFQEPPGAVQSRDAAIHQPACFPGLPRLATRRQPRIPHSGLRGSGPGGAGGTTPRRSRPEDRHRPLWTGTLRLPPVRLRGRGPRFRTEVRL